MKLLFVVNQSATTRPPDAYAYSRNFSFVLDLYQPMVKLLVEVVRVVTGEWRDRARQSVSQSTVLRVFFIV